MPSARSNASVASALLLIQLLAPAMISGCSSGSRTEPTHAPHGYPTSRDYYPEKARRLGLTGRVGLEASCPNGHYKDIVVIDSGGPLLDAGATRLLADANCTPGDPPETRSTLGVIFQLTNKPKVPPFEDNRQEVVITAIASSEK
jgi:Gram-negative bacterial TonB protein C-terminal